MEASRRATSSSSSVHHQFAPLLVIAVSASLLLPATSSYGASDFHRCLSQHIRRSTLISSVIYTPVNPSFKTVLKSTAQNLRYVLPSQPKPELIFLPLKESHVQVAVMCAGRQNINLRIRSGGHDYEGASYASRLGRIFVVLDLQRLRSVRVDIEHNSLWVQSGATIGEVYYRVAEKSRTHAVAAGLCNSLGVGGHLSGGAYGPLMRKHGMGVDHVTDARIVVAGGAVLDRAAMGEDLFWAIRGGGGNNFGVVVWVKIELVAVPVNVTVFTVARTVSQGGTNLVYRWQDVAYRIDDELFTRVIMQGIRVGPGGKTVLTLFQGMYLGNADKLVRLLRRKFPQLNLTMNDCTQTSWINGMLSIFGYPAGTAPEVLLNGKPISKAYFKAKSDFFRSTVPKRAFPGMWKTFLKDDSALMIWNSWGGQTGRVPESATPFPHRGGVKFMCQYLTTWPTYEPPAAVAGHLAWMNRMYEYMAPYASKNPRECYVNYRDHDLGTNVRGNRTYEAALPWGRSYYKDNFYRLARVKTVIDPFHVFFFEQSIPTLYSPHS